MELKRRLGTGGGAEEDGVLIEPLWNWNEQAKRAEHRPRQRSNWTFMELKPL